MYYIPPLIAANLADPANSSKKNMCENSVSPQIRNNSNYVIFFEQYYYSTGVQQQQQNMTSVVPPPPPPQQQQSVQQVPTTNLSSRLHQQISPQVSTTTNNQIRIISDHKTKQMKAEEKQQTQDKIREKRNLLDRLKWGDHPPLLCSNDQKTQDPRPKKKVPCRGIQHCRKTNCRMILSRDYNSSLYIAEMIFGHLSYDCRNIGRQQNLQGLSLHPPTALYW